MNNVSKKSLLNLIIWTIIVVGLIGTFGLVQEEFNQGNICPEILSIPACYIILTCLVLILISQSNLIKDQNWLYFMGVIIAISIATFGTAGNLLGYLECPKTEGGTPMCYLSFLIFFGLLLFKIMTIKLDRK